MMNKLNIAEILKDKPKGTRLYSPLFGECSLEHVKEHTTFSIAVTNNEYFTQSGQFFDIPAGECMLFPSKEMRDWQKFSWKKGEVLKYNNDNSYLIFEKFTDDSYTTFKWKHCINFDEDTVYSSEGIASTEDYSLANRCSCGFIHYLDVLEKKFHGKFNIDTLKFDKIEPTWKKGDILRHNNYDIVVMFDSFINDDHTKFKFNYKLGPEQYDMSSDSTERFTKVSEQETKSYITQIETEYNVKLNNEFSESEKTRSEFKDGDIVAVDLWRKNIRIFKEKENGNNVRWGKYYIGFSFNNDGKLIQTFENYRADCSSDRLATDEEKQQLFSSLAKEGKAWDAEKKQIVDLKPKHEFKPFDKVIVRREDNGNIWQANIFSHIVEKGYYACIMGVWSDILPYNEETAKLVGTTKSLEDIR